MFKIREVIAFETMLSVGVSGASEHNASLGIEMSEQISICFLYLDILFLCELRNFSAPGSPFSTAIWAATITGCNFSIILCAANDDFSSPLLKQCSEQSIHWNTLGHGPEL
ncbi:hypothetical protein D3C81_1982210 [compost metagenome]